MADSELSKRILTGMMIGLVIVGAILAGHIPTFALIVLIITGSVMEFLRLQNVKTHSTNVLLPAFLVLAPVIMMMLSSIKENSKGLMHESPWWLAAFAVALMVYFVSQLKSEIPDIESRLQVFGMSLLLFTTACSFDQPKKDLGGLAGRAPEHGLGSMGSELPASCVLIGRLVRHRFARGDLWHTRRSPSERREEERWCEGFGQYPAGTWGYLGQI
jgi:hypothetical protein